MSAKIPTCLRGVSAGPGEDSPRLDDVRDGEQRAEHDADSTNNDIGNAQELIAPSNDGPRGEDNGFGAAKLGDGEN